MTKLLLACVVCAVLAGCHIQGDNATIYGEANDAAAFEACLGKTVVLYLDHGAATRGDSWSKSDSRGLVIYNDLVITTAVGVLTEIRGNWLVLRLTGADAGSGTIMVNASEVVAARVS